MCFERREVGRLLIERGLSRFGRRLSGDHLLFGHLLQSVALCACDLRLVADRLRGVAGRDSIVVDGLVVVEKLVHRAEFGEQLIGVGCGSGEEELEGGVVAAVAVELCGYLSCLGGGLVCDLRLRVGLRLELIGLRDRVEERLLCGVILVAGRLCRCLGLGDLLGQRIDEVLDARDLGGLRCLVVLRLLDIVPAGVRGGVGGVDAGADAEGADRCDAEDAEAEGVAPGESALLPEGAPLGEARCAAARVSRFARSIHRGLLVHVAPSTGFTHATVATSSTSATANWDAVKGRCRRSSCRNARAERLRALD